MSDDAKTTTKEPWGARMGRIEAEMGGECGAGLLARDPSWPKRPPGCQEHGCGVLVGCFRSDCPGKEEVVSDGR